MLLSIAQLVCQLHLITISMQHTYVQVRESLMWNLTDESLDPEAAAAILCKHAPVCSPTHVSL